MQMDFKLEREDLETSAGETFQNEKLAYKVLSKLVPYLIPDVISMRKYEFTIGYYAH